MYIYISLYIYIYIYIYIHIYIYIYIYRDISFWWVCPSILESLKGSANPKGVGIVPTSGALL